MIKVKGQCQYKVELHVELVKEDLVPSVSEWLKCIRPGRRPMVARCSRRAVAIASGRGSLSKPACYCAEHAEIIENDGKPEYVAVCPNCKCSFGIS